MEMVPSKKKKRKGKKKKKSIQFRFDYRIKGNLKSPCDFMKKYPNELYTIQNWGFNSRGLL